MADNHYALFLICYDIANPKRLVRVHRCLKKRGLPVQYSVFTAEFKRMQVESLMVALLALIDQREDDVRCYGLPKHYEVDGLGRQYFPDDVLLFSENGVNRLLW
jgi:CRISPR-associated protein Cas2